MSQDTTLVHYLESLVKLQAHIKGFITRLKYASKLNALKEKRLASKREETKKPLPSTLKLASGSIRMTNESSGTHLAMPKFLEIPNAVADSSVDS